jgi:hypothetical protein
MYVVVLNDGETYTDLDGCEVMVVPDFYEDDEVDAYISDNYGTGIAVGELLEVWQYVEDKGAE